MTSTVVVGLTNIRHTRTPSEAERRRSYNVCQKHRYIKPAQHDKKQVKGEVTFMN